MPALSEIPITVMPLNSSFDGQRALTITSDTPTIIGRSVDSSEIISGTLKFTSKVVSRRHAHLVFHDKKVYLRDIKSSSGTFLNDQRLSSQGVESAMMELHSGDVIRLGEDCEVNGVLHQSINMKIIIPSLDDDGASATSAVSRRSRQSLQPSLRHSKDITEKSALSLMDAKSYDNLDASSISTSGIVVDTQFRLDIENEFNGVWMSLTQGLDLPIRRLKHLAKEHVVGMMTQGIYTPYIPTSESLSSSISDLHNPRSSLLPSASPAGSVDALEGSRYPSARLSRTPGLGFIGGINTGRTRQSSAMSSASTTPSIASASSIASSQNRMANTLSRHL
ncbi:hypothetical protein BASA50_009757 [Batrachochytrium salamandrivorans]|uniref:FHA domain-containing protein n=1 Tax=Batrachochytrium salamandrivorans TaxID=1357716 RepID=A0ABQ8F0S7_9FUNG|nr:hypothetical protein BASA62_004685 [Batrachochytrium salamandrivorans]KAH6570958.1 hypothetical protein BASA60_007387 [Batrachochytrium salamandrivorans]KAH6590056.1 hypothetical protein BASA50_009757 [Batrachochytrium salamandrivorans]KAH6592335.1 hypothetical protein BASA61_004658 [Batrachochytrium salamandrivorans]KAH9252651.1 hypothetical protein BASA81_009432 [Batrachochytrium salamandrivorans]